MVRQHQRLKSLLLTQLSKLSLKTIKLDKKYHFLANQFYFIVSSLRSQYANILPKVTKLYFPEPPPPMHFHKNFYLSHLAKHLCYCYSSSSMKTKYVDSQML